MSFSFGQPTPAVGSTFSNPPTSSGFGFGTGFAATTSAAPTFNFGTSATQNVMTSSGFQFGAGTTAAPSFNFGTSAPSTNFQGFNVGSNLPSSTGVSFGTSTAPSLGFPQTTGLGATITSTPLFSGLSTNVVTTKPAAPSLGLGGINSTPFGGGLTTSTAQDKTDPKALKELSVPNEIMQTVEEFKKYVKEQKTMKEEVSRGSSKALEKVGEEVEALKNLLASLANNIQRHAGLVHKLKHDTQLEIQNAEMAQRTKETASNFQLDNTGPMEYFFHLVKDFEQRMQLYKQQIEDTERNLLAMDRQQSLTPKELMATMKKLHEAFVSLAGRVHTIHSALQNCKDDYLTYRRRIHGDSTDIFSSKGSSSLKMNAGMRLSKVGSGPTPFGGTSDLLSCTLTHLINSVQQTGASNFIGGGLNFTSLANSSVLPSLSSSNASIAGFSTTNRPTGLFGGMSQSTLPTENRTFQLQSPPLGNKRNKR
nr:EOG090X0D34 [Cyclestheria hislopi]